MAPGPCGADAELAPKQAQQLLPPLMKPRGHADANALASRYLSWLRRSPARVGQGQIASATVWPHRIRQAPLIHEKGAGLRECPMGEAAVVITVQNHARRPVGKRRAQFPRPRVPAPEVTPKQVGSNRSAPSLDWARCLAISTASKGLERIACLQQAEHPTPQGDGRPVRARWSTTWAYSRSKAACAPRITSAQSLSALPLSATASLCEMTHFSGASPLKKSRPAK